MNEKSLCLNCGALTASTELFNVESLTRCVECGGWSYGSTGVSLPPQLYEEHYFSGGEYLDYVAGAQVHALNFKRKISLLRKYILTGGQPRRLLELGCATGQFLRLFCDLVPDSKVLGIEVSQYARSIAERHGVDVMSPDAKELPRRLREFNANLIVAWDVWEHLSSPVLLFRDLLTYSEGPVAVALTTVDAGSFVARMRRAKWRQYHPPTHLHYPTMTSLNRFFSSLGFTVVYHGSFGYHRPLAEYVAALGPRFKKRAQSYGLLYRIPFYLNLYDTQLLIGFKDSTTGI